MLYRIVATLLIALSLHLPAFCEVTPIDAQRAAQAHNNLGVDYFKEGDYLAAIKEFKIAIGINPNNQTTAVYNNNLGRTYLALARLSPPRSPFPAWAQISFESAISQDCMNFSFYENLVESFKLQGNLGERLSYYKKDSAKNPFSSLTVALIHEKRGDKLSAIVIYNDFIKNFPDLIITNDVKKHLETAKTRSE